MKNTINYYYNLIPNNIHQKNDSYTLYIKDHTYLLTPYYGNINNLNIIYNYLINLNIYCHEIIYNKDNSIITILNDKPYILLKIYYNNDYKISIQNILSYNIYIKSEKKINWHELWCKKLDYYEYQIREFGKKYPLIRDSFSYYNGLCELAISLLNSINIENINMYICHQRIKKNTSTIDFYNPLNLVIDVRIRDICEYFKIRFFDNENIIYEIKNYFNSFKLSKEEMLLFFIRLLYPSYYFDMYDEIIQGKIKEDNITKYTKKTKEFEILLKNIYITINNYVTMPEIDWIIKM